MTEVITRFAPSPTGMLHVGNARTAIINWLYAKKHGGKFLLRFDDTDLVRSKQEYKDAIERDLKWLGLDWDLLITQSERLDRYAKVKDELIAQWKLYPCFETQEELEIKRKLQLNKGMPPLYDRAALKLSKEQIDEYIKRGRRPHYRFRISTSQIQWHDMVKGELKYAGHHLSDPIVIREDGSMTYMLSSVIDDIDYCVTDIIRGEDHVTNTALQIEMFHALNAINIPNLGHLSLIHAKDEKISKRIGGFDVAHLRDVDGLEAMTINSFLGTIGSSHTLQPHKQMQHLIDEFDIRHFSTSPTTYLPEELLRLNHKLLITLHFVEIQQRLIDIECDKIDEQFWLTIRQNIQRLHDVKDWYKILREPKIELSTDPELLKLAISLLPQQDIDSTTCVKWFHDIKLASNKSGKELFVPLRLAITGMQNGPELKDILQLIDRQELLNRLNKSIQ